jgi:hypothetical protein
LTAPHSINKADLRLLFVNPNPLNRSIGDKDRFTACQRIGLEKALKRPHVSADWKSKKRGASGGFGISFASHLYDAPRRA